MAGRVLAPEHDLVEIDRLRLGAPVAIDAEARLSVDEGDAVALGAVLGVAQRAVVGAAGAAVEPDFDPPGRVVRREEPDVDGGPGLARYVVGDADLLALHL